MKSAATCHPGAARYCRGLCLACYIKQPDIKATMDAYAKSDAGRATRAKWASSPAGKANRHRRRLLNEYGLTVADYDAMLAEQGMACAICRLPAGELRLAVDHCHATREVRGLLCHACNLVLGNARDQVVILKRAIAYLEARRS